MRKERFQESMAWRWHGFVHRQRMFGDGKYRGIFYLFVFMALISLIRYGKMKYPEWKEAHSGIPDAVSSMSINNDHHLKVAANSSRIEDREELARRIIHMCQDNSFHSIRFSTDVNGYPSELHISVYLNRKEVEGGDPVFEIEFSTDDFREEYDIKNDADKFRLYLDGEEIDFY